MFKQIIQFLVFFSFLSVIILAGFNFPVYAQKSESTPEISVAGIELGNREKAKAFLANHSPRIGDDGRPAYYFYNKFGTQVMKITAISNQDPYFITELEVFAVGTDYQNKHFIADKIGFFATESGIFIGYRQSTASMIIGIPNVSREDRIGPKDLVRKKGSPRDRVKTGERETITYNFEKIILSPSNSETNVSAEYKSRFEFVNNKLKRFSLKVIPLINP